MVVTKDMTLWDIMQADKQTIDVLRKYGLNCMMCNGAATETLEMATLANHIDLQVILSDLNRVLS